MNDENDILLGSFITKETRNQLAANIKATDTGMVIEFDPKTGSLVMVAVRGGNPLRWAIQGPMQADEAKREAEAAMKRGDIKPVTKH